MEKKKEVRTRRIGTVTFGCMLIFFGLLFLVHMFVPQLTYEWIFRMWPVMFIGLGLEILMAGAGREETRIYDGTAMFLLVFLTLFAMGMAVADLTFSYYSSYLHF